MSRAYVHTSFSGASPRSPRGRRILQYTFISTTQGITSLDYVELVSVGPEASGPPLRVLKGYLCGRCGQAIDHYARTLDPKLTGTRIGSVANHSGRPSLSLYLVSFSVGPTMWWSQELFVVEWVSRSSVASISHAWSSFVSQPSGCQVKMYIYRLYIYDNI